MKISFLKDVTVMFLVTAVMLAASCKKESVDNNNTTSTNTGGTKTTGTTTDTTGTLIGSATTAADFPNIGFAVTYGTMSTNAAYVGVVKREANYVTFGNELKYGSIVQNDGTFNYTTADALYAICANNGLSVLGHNLCWYSQQNATYLNGLITALNKQTGTPTNLMQYGDFEAGTGSNFTGWTNIVGGTAVGSFSAVTDDNDGGSRAMQATVTTPGANAYDMQSIGTAFTVTPNKAYKVTVSIKSAAAGTVRLVMQNTVYQQDDLTTTPGWATYTWNLTITEASPILRFNFPAAGVYVIDNVSVTDPNSGTVIKPTPAQVATVIDTALHKFINTTVTRYKGKIKAWDVVNEPMADGTGALRDTNNYTIPAANINNQFLWSEYLGRNFGLKAFQYAKAADPNALLFINEYNLEYSYKLDSLIAYTQELIGKGAKIDGIGTQMHINLQTSQASIDNELIKLAQTGLLVRISELDIALNTSKSSSFVPTAAMLTAQAALYKYVVQSYLKNVPKAQRFGITIWGLTDNESWINTPTAPDAPLLFNQNLTKKPAYYSFLLGLKGM
ncbi:endo-1,4-beta-xylanase [Mucilaginibacter sp. X5P1]|uniref:endo-1,4-beta-xylanase n=1 Tax=Mucilaginibacter sp. X5P1 TaxID=2723088 RepID=UPI00160F3692|nr:endo-1,4-beta-xylanase [Mucilaginibacter sp. X5P1]MBB6138741.1 endo-1,4-beta-xylanase [Mucilaginibacter sp. X5P1]